MSKFLSIAALMVTVLATSPSAFAQRRDSHGLWKPHYDSAGPGRSYAGRSYSGRSSFSRPYAGPTYAAPAQAYQSFSFEPVGINPGDAVVVNRDAKLMLGRNIVADVPAGLQFRVTKVVNGWLGAIVDVDGQQQKGWIWNAQVRLAEAAPPSGG